MTRFGLIAFGMIAMTGFGCAALDREYVAPEQGSAVVGPKATPSDRWRNACVVGLEQQLRALSRKPVIHDFWYQTPEVAIFLRERFVPRAPELKN